MSHQSTCCTSAAPMAAKSSAGTQHSDQLPLTTHVTWHKYRYVNKDHTCIADSSFAECFTYVIQCWVRKLHCRPTLFFCFQYNFVKRGSILMILSLLWLSGICRPTQTWNWICHISDIINYVALPCKMHSAHGARETVHSPNIAYIRLCCNFVNCFPILIFFFKFSACQTAINCDRV